MASCKLTVPILLEWNDIKAYMEQHDIVEIVRCKDCKNFELNHAEHIDGIPLILAHHICTRWGNGCKTDVNGYCFMGEVTE